MTFTDKVTSFFHNAVYGTLSDSQLQAIKDDTASQIAQASAGADPAVVAARVSQANNDIDKAMIAINAHPSQSTFLGSSGFANLATESRKIIYIFVGVLAILMFIQFFPMRRR